MKCSDEISVGEFVRTEFGNIGRFYRPASENSDVYCIYKRSDGLKISTRYDSIVKHSKEIIDLIEEGDYVNGYKVLYVCNEEPCPSGKYVDIDCNKPSEESYFFEDEIKTIITREQIKQIEYRIKE